MEQATHIGHDLEILALRLLQMLDLGLLKSDLLTQRVDDAFRENLHGLVGRVGGDAVDIGLGFPAVRPRADQSADAATAEERENQRAPKLGA